MDDRPDSRPENSGDERPLSPAQIGELGTAMQRAGKVLGAARVAGFTGWTVGAFGALSLLVSLFSPTGVLVGGGLMVVAWNELEGRKMLLRFDPEGPRRLARNQLWLLAVIVAYCLVSMYRARFNPTPGVTEMESLLGLGEGFFAGAALAAYGMVLTVGVFFQWGMYRYHAARVRLVEAYVAQTPAWIIEVQRIVGGGQPGG